MKSLRGVQNRRHHRATVGGLEKQANDALGVGSTANGFVLLPATTGSGQADVAVQRARERRADEHGHVQIGEHTTAAFGHLAKVSERARVSRNANQVVFFTTAAVASPFGRGVHAVAVGQHACSTTTVRAGAAFRSAKAGIEIQLRVVASQYEYVPPKPALVRNSARGFPSWVLISNPFGGGGSWRREITIFSAPVPPSACGRGRAWPRQRGSLAQQQRLRTLVVAGDFNSR